MTELRDAAMTSKAWPFEEARRLLKRYEAAPPDKGHVLFETGYGPSGLPHIGTFGEVLRTTMIRRAFEVITDIPTRLICFSDDMDGDAQGAGQRPQPGNAARAPAEAADAGPPTPSARTRASGTTTTRCCAGFSTRSGSNTSSIPPPTSTPRGSFDEILLRAAERYDALMKVIAEIAPRGTAADLFHLPAAAPRNRPRPLRPDQACRCEGRHRDLRRRNGARMDGPRHGWPVQASVEARLRRALGRAWRRLRDVWQGSLDQHADLRRDPARSWVTRRPSISPTSFSSTRPGRRSRNPPATASRSTNGSATPRPRACRISCTRSPRRRSGSIST